MNYNRNLVYKNVLETIGNTPIVKLNQVAAECSANLYGKMEFMNPGGSIKDRLGLYLIEDAERRGALKPGGTIVEGTSGNTGFGLAIAAAIKGYKCIFVLPDKMSEEKIKNLRAFGAKVVVTPTAVAPEDPRSYYSVSKRLTEETPNSFYANQYNNLANRECHYKWTGPEILKQMPDIDVFIAGIGTGGTICGVGKYLKEHKPDVKVVAVDPIGSIVYDKFKSGKDVEAHTYKIEGIGEDFIPGNYDFSVIDDMVQVEDKESFLMTRDLLKKEGLYTGVSTGSAVVGAMRWIKEQGDALKGKNVLTILCDSGNRYLSKVYDDDWMREAGFLDHESIGSVADLLGDKLNTPPIMIDQNKKVQEAIALMQEKGFSQLPVCDENGWIKGIVEESKLLSGLFQDTISKSDLVGTIADASIEFVQKTDPIETITRLVTQGKTPLVMNKDKTDVQAIITKIDIISFLGK